MNRLPALTKFVAALIGVLFVVQIIVSFVVSSVGPTISEFETRARELRFENQQISEQVAQYEALSYLDSKTSDLGFVKAPIVYLTPASEQALTPVAARLTQ